MVVPARNEEAAIGSIVERTLAAWQPILSDLSVSEVEVIAALKAQAERSGPLQESNDPDHPRRVQANTVGYFEAHRHRMDSPTIRRKG